MQPARVGLVTVLRKHQLARHLGHVVALAARLGRGAVLQHLLQRLVALRLGDEAVVQHALDDVTLPDDGTPGVAQGVVGRGRLGQAGQHGGLGHGQLLQRLAEVDLAGRGKAVGPVPQEDLVHVDLQDLVLGHQGLDLEGQQDLVDLAGEGLFGAEVEIARQLHRDGGRALALGLCELRQRSPQHPLEVHTAVAVEVRVLDGEHRVLHHLGNLVDGRVDAAFLAELREQRAVGREDAQGLAGSVVGEAAGVRQVGRGKGQRQGQQQGPGKGQPDKPRQAPCEPAPAAAGGGGRVVGGGRCCGRCGVRLSSHGACDPRSKASADYRKRYPRAVPSSAGVLRHFRPLSLIALPADLASLLTDSN